MPDVYVDNNETIYAYETSYDPNLPPVSVQYTTLGLEDLLPDLSGQSTWLINRIHFFVKFMGIESSPQTNGSTVLSAVTGISPYGWVAAGNSLSTPGDYSDLKGWPLKGGTKYLGLQDDTSQNVTSWSKTYSPSKGNHLALNRNQEIVLSSRIFNYPDALNCNILSSIIVEARRGD